MDILPPPPAPRQIKVPKPLLLVSPLRLLYHRTVAPLTRTPQLPLQNHPKEGEQKNHKPRIPFRSSQAHGGKSFWGPCGALPAPALAGTHRPSRPRSADAPAGPGPESHLCNAPAAPAPRTPASRARLTASSFPAAAARGAPWPGPRCSSRGPAPPLGPAPAGPAPAGSAACSAPGPEAGSGQSHAPGLF